MRRLGLHLALIFFAVFFMLPVVWLLLAPFSTDQQLVVDPLSFGSVSNLKRSVSAVSNYQDGVIWRWTLNSLVLALGSMVGVAISCLPAGYAMALLRFRGRSTMLLLTLITMIMPAAVLILPIFLEMNALQLVGTPWAVILPSSFFTFGTYLCYIYYSSNFPPELISAARVDGCSELGIFLRIGLPLGRPILAMVLFFSFVGNWNNYFLPFVMLPESSTFPLPVGLQTVLSSSQAFNPVAAVGQTEIMRPELAVFILWAAAPVLAIFLIAQRHLVGGIAADAVKG